MELDDIPLERMILLFWSMIVLFTDRFDFFPNEQVMKIIAAGILLVMVVLSFISSNSKRWDERKKFTSADYIKIMESKGFHFTEEQKEKARREKKIGSDEVKI